MSGRRMLVTSVIILVIMNLITLVLLIRASWVNLLWKQQMDGMARYAATVQAMNDYRTGKLCLYELVENGDREFANRYDGPFEVWYYPYHPILGQPDKYAQETFIEGYNRKMRYMYEHPEKFKPLPDDNTDRDDRK